MSALDGLIVVCGVAGLDIQAVNTPRILLAVSADAGKPLSIPSTLLGYANTGVSALA